MLDDCSYRATMSLFEGLKREVDRTIRDVIVNGMMAAPVVPPQLRWRLLSAVGLKIARSHIASHCFFGSRRMSVGLGTFINRECFFDGSDRIDIGERVRIGMRCTFITGSHEVGPPEQRAGEAIAAPIVVGSGAWIGAGAVVLPGVRIGAGAIVAAGAVVTRSVGDGAVVGGVPARPIAPKEDAH
jgi:maltose O-acetyltransferase